MKGLTHKFYDFNRPASESLDAESRFNDAVLRFYDSYTKNSILFQFSKEHRTIEHWCFECKAKIDVDITPILRGLNWSGSELFCDSHKPKTSKEYKSYLFIRYEDAFYAKIRHALLATTV